MTDWADAEERAAAEEAQEKGVFRKSGQRATKTRGIDWPLAERMFVHGGVIREDGKRVYPTLEEIGRILARYPEIGRVKDSFPGAMVTAFRPRTHLAVDLDEDIPF